MVLINETSKIAEIVRRIEKIENTMESLRAADARTDQALSELNVTLALLNQTVDAILERDIQRRTLTNRIVAVVVGGFLTAIVAWIIRGGLSP